MRHVHRGAVQHRFVFAADEDDRAAEPAWTGRIRLDGGDCHVYDNHVDQVLEQLSREPYPYPNIEIRKADSLFDYQYEDFTIVDYRHHPTIKAPVAV